MLKNKKNTHFFVRVSTIDDGGERGVRTLAHCYMSTSFPSPPLQPLGYFSVWLKRYCDIDVR